MVGAHRSDPHTLRGGSATEGGLEMADSRVPLDRDEKKLAELGYKQELDRGWSRFANFAISFSIISVLAGCFTLYGQAWQFGGPIAISIGWPVIAIIIMAGALRMFQLPSALPTPGRPCWGGARPGGAG